MLEHYCQNELTITGPADDIAAFSHTVEGTEDLLTLQRLLPEPDIAGLGGPKGWLNWRATHWGCKWDALDVERHQSSRTQILYNYETGFGVAVHPIREASRLWPELTFTLSYAAPAGGHAGSITLHNARIVEERLGRYAELYVEGPNGTEPDPVLLASLTAACGRLPYSTAPAVATELRQELLASGPDGIADSATRILGLGDPGIVLEYCVHPLTTQDRVWDLLVRSLGDVRGGSVLLALRAASEPRLRVIAGVLSHMQAALLTPNEVLEVGVDIVEREQVALLRQMLEAAEKAGDLKAFAETLQELSLNWDGCDFDEFLDAAWCLHF